MTGLRSLRGRNAVTCTLIAALTTLGVAVPPATPSGEAPPKCPSGILVGASADAPVSEVVGAVQRELAGQTIDSQGTTYHLTPKNAPIEYVAQVGQASSPQDQRAPGLVALFRAASAACGANAAIASWAVSYSIPVAVVANEGGYVFVTKTRKGWISWGDWCGTGKSTAWRMKSCP